MAHLLFLKKKMISKTSLLLAILALTSSIVSAQNSRVINGNSSAETQEADSKSSGTRVKTKDSSKATNACNSLCNKVKKGPHSVDSYNKIGTVGNKCTCKITTILSFSCKKFDAALDNTRANRNAYFAPIATGNWHCLKVKIKPSKKKPSKKQVTKDPGATASPIVKQKTVIVGNTTLTLDEERDEYCYTPNNIYVCLNETKHEYCMIKKGSPDVCIDEKGFYVDQPQGKLYYDKVSKKWLPSEKTGTGKSADARSAMASPQTASSSQRVNPSS